MRKFLVMVTVVVSVFAIGSTIARVLPGGGEQSHLVGGFPGEIIDEIGDEPEEPDPGIIIYHAQENNNQGMI